MNTLIAVPSSAPGGLDAPVEPHFGHCDLYTLVALENTEIRDVQVVPSIPHQQGGCMAPVQYLADKQVGILIAGGMGFRPLTGFAQVGIEVYHGGKTATVGAAVEALVNGELPLFTQNQTCGGSAAGGCH